MRRAVLILLLAGCDSLDTPPEYPMPSVFSVKQEVAVRTDSSVSALPAGSLPGGAQPILIDSVTEDRRFGRLVWREANGWVPMESLTLLDWPKIGSTGLPMGLVCTGTEPFWSLTIPDGESLSFNQMGEPTQSTPVATAEATASGARIAGEAITLTVRPEGCSDGMSDRIYPWSAAVSVDGPEGRAYGGCCRLPIEER